MKVQCQCGAKYSIDVTPEMARDPIRFVCPNCNTDLSGPINDLVREELGLTAAPQRAILATADAPAPAAPPPPPAAAAPARLSLHKTANAATHGTAVETATPGGGDSDDGKPCPKHQGEVIVAHCYMCRKPLCPKCMELFGYVCSPLCRAKAEANGINVPVFAGQKSVIEARRWRKTGRIGLAISAALVLLLGFWVWWAWFGTFPHAIFSVQFPERSYAGNSRIVGKQIVFLHGGLLARYPLGSKTAVWTNEIITQQQVEAEVDRQLAEYKAELDNAIRHGADSTERPHVPMRDEMEKYVEQEMQHSLQLFVQDQNIWVAQNGMLTQYDWDTGKAGKQIKLPSNRADAAVSGGELLFTDENAFGQHVVTHVSLASGESRTEEIGERQGSAVLAQTSNASGKSAPGKKGDETTGLPTKPGVDTDKTMDPAKVAADAQKLPYAAKLALPATLSNTKHQNDILKEIDEDEGRDPNPAAAQAVGRALARMGFSGHRGFVNSKFGYVEWSSKVLEQKGRSRTVMKAKPTRSALENNPSVTNTTAIANEILNDMQRDRGGDSVTEDVSRYQVSVHRADAKDVPDWTGEVVGVPSIIEQKTVTVVTGLQMFVVLDKNNKKLWEANLTYNLGHGSGLDDNDPSQTSVGLGPCVEHGDTLYVYDEAALTAYDLSNGNVRWRVPTIGIVGLFFDDVGSVYVNSTTADLDTLRFARQIDIDKKITASVLRVDCKTGKVYWTTQPGGFLSHVDGKFVFCFASHQAPDLDPDALTTLPGMLDSAMAIRRLDPKTGKELFYYTDRRAPLSVRFKDNVIELVFRKEVQVLKFLTL